MIVTNYEQHDAYGMYKIAGNGSPHADGHHGPSPRLMSAETLNGSDVFNKQDDYLGDIKEFTLDMKIGRVSCAVPSFGGFLGMGDTLFAAPWNALRLDAVNTRLGLTVDTARLESAPGFDEDDWPNMSGQTWALGIRLYDGTKPNANDLSM